MTLPELAHSCAQETENYFHNLQHDSTYCFEMFRRAVRDQDQAAWEMIYIQYNALVSGWVRQNQRFEASGEEVQYFVNGAFAKISRNLTADKFAGFQEISFILRYLKMCVHSVIVDYDRSAHQAGLVALEDIAEKEAPGPTVERLGMDQSYRKAFWDWIDQRLHNDKERAVIRGAYILELKPQELYEQFRSHFSDLDEVYRVKQNVLARLRRDDEFQKLLEQYA
jgi:hypothetical protein